MPRVKPRKVIGKFFLFSLSSFLLFNLWVFSSKDSFSGNAIMKMFNFLYQKPKEKQNYEKFLIYKWTSADRPWFMQNGTLRPNEQSPYFSQLYVFPDPINDNDRITNQLMYVPPIENARRSRKLKKILLHVDGSTSYRDLPLGQAAFLRDKCLVNTCELTMDFGQAETADAILFKDRFRMPKHRRPPGQIWILYLLECPMHTPSFKKLKGHINWTATYRHDSDLVTPYEKFVYYRSNVFKLKQTRNYAEGKTRKVAWFVSNCAAKNRRLQFARELSKYIQVDIYGSCGEKSCSRRKSRDCFRILNEQYKFYLSFENSNCRDYITEKFYVNGLQNDVVPIVMGAHPDDYERVSPQNSYIHVDHFDSPKHLAQYLLKLDHNDSLYNTYFEWKGSGSFINTYFWCRLCAMLHSDAKPKHYADFNYWWSKPSLCNRYKWDAFSLKRLPKYDEEGLL